MWPKPAITGCRTRTGLQQTVTCGPVQFYITFECSRAGCGLGSLQNWKKKNQTKPDFKTLSSSLFACSSCATHTNIFSLTIVISIHFPPISAIVTGSTKVTKQGGTMMTKRGGTMTREGMMATKKGGMTTMRVGNVNESGTMIVDRRQQVE